MDNFGLFVVYGPIVESITMDANGFEQIKAVMNRMLLHYDG